MGTVRGSDLLVAAGLYLNLSAPAAYPVSQDQTGSGHQCRQGEDASPEAEKGFGRDLM